MIEEKRVEDSRVETVHIIRPNHLNAAGRLFGGMLMQWLDEVAGMVAKRHTRANVITASVDNLRFIHGAYKGEMVVIVGKVTYVGTTSMEVRVDTYVEHMEDGMRRPINRAYFTMVALARSITGILIYPAIPFSNPYSSKRIAGFAYAYGSARFS